MGDSKNLKWSHTYRGKYIKLVVPKTKNSSKLYHNGSSIINLNKVKKHLKVVTQHATTCQVCANDAFILTGEQNNNGLCSVLTSHCAGCHTDFKFSTSSIIKGMSGGHYWECNLLQCGDRWLQGRICPTYRINGCARCTFTDNKGIYDNRETNWPVVVGSF